MSKKQLTVRKSLEEASIPSADKPRRQQILQKWEKLDNSLSGDSIAKARDDALVLVRDLGELLGFQDVTPINATHHPSLLCDRQLRFYTDRLRVLKQTVRFLVMSRERLGRDDYETLKDIASSSGFGNRIFLVLVPEEAPILRDQSEKERAGLIILDSVNIADMLAATSPRRILNRIIRRQTDINLIQPYDQYSPAGASMFFGRKTELKKILTNREKSFALYGGRRVGKTSLLVRVFEHIKNDPSQQVVFISAQGIRANVDLCSKIADAVLTGKGDGNIRSTPVSLDNFSNFIKRQVITSSKPLTILIDEVDDFIILDRRRGEEVLSILKSINQEMKEGCRFIFAGFRVLDERLSTYYSSVMNFFTPILLEELDSKSAKELVEIPIGDELAYEFESPELVDEILQCSSRNPCHIQHFCCSLTELAYKNNKDVIERKAVNDVFASFDFRNSITEIFMNNSTPLQQEIVFLFLESTNFTPYDVNRKLLWRGISENPRYLVKELDKMVKYGILSKTRQTYSFANPVFPIILKESQPIPLLISAAEKEIKKRGTQ